MGLAGMGGGLNPLGGVGSLVGGLGVGAINRAMGGRFSDGFQVGELAGGILGGGFYDGLESMANYGIKATALNVAAHSGAHKAMESAFAGAGYGIGSALTGTRDGALMGANIGSNIGGIAANFLVACFTRETPIVTSLEGDARRAE